MHFDDRLQTLLAAPVADPRDRAVRWRQLVDLLSRQPQLHGELASSACAVVRRDATAIDEDVRAATVRAIAGRALPADLLAIFAGQPVRIAAPLFAGLTLGRAEAERILADADPEVRALVHIAPEPAATLPPLPAEPPAPAAPTISDMVSRIERLQQLRAPAHHAMLAPHCVQPAPTPQEGRSRHRVVEPEHEPRLFEWESDSLGHIAWVDGVPRGALIGRALGGEGEALLEPAAASQLARHHPFVDVALAPVNVLDGQWSATGMPAFDPATGRFLGYRGTARRIDGSAAAADGEPDLDALRELIHEIKTPLNAIIGFAEIIDGQYLGPAHLPYRRRAAEIVVQARQLLSATEDLDFAARLKSSRADSGAGTQFAEIFPRLAEEMNAYANRREAGMLYSLAGTFQRCALDPELSERLVRRFVTAVIDVAEAGETLTLGIGPREGMCAISLSRPQRLRGTTDEELIDPAFAPGTESQIGLGFALRLVRGLARIAGGDLRFEIEQLHLLIPSRRSGR